jgi:hypothetical protein
MKKWIRSTAAILALSMAGVIGCGAKLPTVSEESQGDPYEQKLEINTEYVEDTGFEGTPE